MSRGSLVVRGYGASALNRDHRIDHDRHIDATSLIESIGRDDGDGIGIRRSLIGGGDKSTGRDGDANGRWIDEGGTAISNYAEREGEGSGATA